MSQPINNPVNEVKYMEVVPLTVPKVKCPTHGIHEHGFYSSIEGHEGAWCIICMINTLEKLGIHKVEKV